MLQLNSFDVEQSAFPQYGNLKCLMFNRQNQPLIVLGPHYPLFMVAWLICAFLLVLLLYTSFPTLSFAWFLLLCFSSFLFLASYAYMGLSAPSIAPLKSLNKADEQSIRFCMSCRIVRPLRTEHCPDCGVCIEELDHHCPWIGKCVGKTNLKAFYFFIAITFGNLILCFLATALNELTKQKGQSSHK